LMKTVTIIAGAALLLTPLFISRMAADATCEGVVITIADSSKHQFVTDDDIMKALSHRHPRDRRKDHRDTVVEA